MEGKQIIRERPQRHHDWQLHLNKIQNYQQNNLSRSLKEIKKQLKNTLFLVLTVDQLLKHGTL